MFRTSPHLIVVVALLVSVLGGLDSVEAQSPPPPVRCGGNTLKKVALRAQQFDPTELRTRNLYVPLPGAEIAYNAALGGDLFTVTFSAACRLRGASSGPSDETVGDHIGVIVVVDDGVNPELVMEPGAVPFCSDNRWAMHSATFCRGVNAGTNTVRVYGALIDDPQDPQTANLFGVLDNWTLQLLVND
jgi:hypothetical protein